jgi:hypothetical protein
MYAELELERVMEKEEHKKCKKERKEKSFPSVEFKSIA